MKRAFVLSLLIFGITFTLIAQEEESIETILEAPKSWRKEIIPFPLPFAPGLDFKGFEDIRFAKGWANKDSEEFWTYTFVWCLEDDPQLSEEKLDEIIAGYFDGLMWLVASEKVKADSVTKTSASFIKNSKKESYVGKVTIFDGFFLLKPTRLHVTAEQNYCVSTKKYLVRFNLSPKGFDDDIWKSFEKVIVKLKCK